MSIVMVQHHEWQEWKGRMMFQNNVSGWELKGLNSTAIYLNRLLFSVYTQTSYTFYGRCRSTANLKPSVWTCSTATGPPILKRPHEFQYAHTCMYMQAHTTKLTFACVAFFVYQISVWTQCPSFASVIDQTTLLTNIIRQFACFSHSHITVSVFNPWHHLSHRISKALTYQNQTHHVSPLAGISKASSSCH